MASEAAAAAEASLGKRFLFNYNDLRINLPFRMQISGASGSGKSQIIAEFIRFREQMFEGRFHRIIYCRPKNDGARRMLDYVATLKSYCDFLEIHYDLPNVKALDLLGKKTQSLVIMDDLANVLYGSPEMAHLFSNVSNHENLSLVCVTQNLFPRDKHKRDITTNLTHYLLVRDKGDHLSVKTLSGQITGKAHLFQTCLDWTGKNIRDEKKDGQIVRPLRYLLISLHSRSNLDSRFLLSTQIFPIANGDGTFKNPRPILFLPD